MATIAQPRPAPAPANSRNPQFRTPLFLAGVGLALVAFLAMFTFGLIFAAKAGSGAQVTVVVAQQPISARDAIDVNMLTTVRMPASSAMPAVFSTVTSLDGYYAVVDIPKGQAITPNMVAKNLSEVPIGASPVIDIPAGYVVVTIPSAEQQGVAGYVAQGDYVDIMVTVDKAAILKGAQGSVTTTAFTSVYVVRVGPETTAPRQGQPQGLTSSLTVLMSQCDAEYMFWFNVNASVRYSLLSKTDYPVLPTTRPACSSTEPPGSPVGPRAIESRYHILEG